MNHPLDVALAKIKEMTPEERFEIYHKVGIVTKNGELSIVYGGKAIDSDEELEKFALDTVYYPGFAPHESVLIDLLSRVWDNHHYKEIVLKVYNRELNSEFYQEIIQKTQLVLERIE